MKRESVKGKEQGHVASQEAPESKTVASRPAGANDSIVGLHRGAGNRAVASLLAPSSGGPLDGGTREEMESKFGADFGGVRVHRDENAAKTALAAGARAITTGQDIVFGPGFYAPGTPDGRRLIGHELAHVMQQSQKGQRVSKSAAEAEARQAGVDVVAGRGASVQSAAPAGAQADPMSKEEIQNKIAENELRAKQAGPQEIAELFRQREDLMRQLHDLEALPGPAPPPQSIQPSAPRRKQEVSLRGMALDVGERDLDKPSFRDFGDFGFIRKPSRPRDLTSVREIVKQGTPMKTSVAITHWSSRAEMEQFMKDYIAVADEDPATKPQADQARKDREEILGEVMTAQEDIVAQRLQQAEGEQHVEDVKTMLRVPVPEGIKPFVAVGEVGIRTVEWVDALANFIPYVGEIKMLLEGVTGMTISGQLNKAIYAPGQLGTADLDTFDRIMSILPIAIAGASKIVSQAPGWMEALARLRRGTNLSEEALGTVLRDTAKLAGREKEVAHALLALREQRKAAAVAKLEELAGAKPPSNVVSPSEPKPSTGGKGTSVSEASKPAAPAAVPAPPAAAAAKAARKSFASEMQDALKKASDPDHPLHQLTEEAPKGSKTPRQFRKVTRVTESGKTQTGRYHGGETGPVVQAGHADAYASGAPQRFVLEDADINQLTGQVIESKGAFSSKGALFVTKADGTGGIWVESESLKQWERLGAVPPGTVDAAVKRTAALSARP
jgi:hypothetical protein